MNVHSSIIHNKQKRGNDPNAYQLMNRKVKCGISTYGILLGNK